jgi:hypothetical protein
MLTSGVAVAGGPKYIAGTSYFNAGVVGQPVHWLNGQVNYYVDQGPLNSGVSNQQATAMVDAAAALWTAIPTAGVTLTDKGALNEDVSGANAVAGNQSLTSPADVTAAAINYPVAVIYDADGSVMDAVFGAYTSDPSNCENNGVMVWLDNIQPDATVVHAVMLLNGRCATTQNLLTMMSFQLERAFGRVLGLGFAQVNPGAETNGESQGLYGWPVMEPGSGLCSATGGNCIPDPGTLRWDDIAEVNRMYPITAANLAQFPGKEITAANTVSITGTISFRAGMGMQGVNVVARPLDASGNPLYQYATTFVSGSYFSGNHGNAVTGWTDTNGLLLSQWGSEDATLQGYFDLRFIPLPPGVTSANFQVTFETVSPMYIYSEAVGPYTDGTPQPSGTLAPIALAGLTAGANQTLAVNVADSATGEADDAISTQAMPRRMPVSGLWCGRLSQVGQTDWFNFPVRANRTFTVVTVALDEQGQATNFKAMPAIGIWDAFAAVGSASVATSPGLNGNATGESWLQVTTSGDDVVRLGIADMRGDGRPDYAYNGWVVYADTVSPTRLPAAGGAIVIHGMGFRTGDTVLVGGRSAVVTSISPNEITAIAPAAATGVMGSVDVEVNDLPIYYAYAVISGGVSYDAGTGDSLTLVTAPANTVPTGVPTAFTVTALGANGAPAGGVTVTYSVNGTATLGCGAKTCAVTTTGDGGATMTVTAVDGSASVVTAALTNGASLQAHLSGGSPPVLAALTPTLSLAAGTTVSWTTQALVLNNGVPLGGQTVAWQTGSGIAATGSTSAASAASGIAAKTLTAGPLTKGQQAAASACLNGTTQCVTFNAFGARPEYATVEAVAGTAQSLAVSGTPGLITLRVRDMDGNPMAGGAVTLYQALYAWAPPCPPQGRCDAAQLLGVQAATGTSGLDGTVTFTPASRPGVATNMVGLAATGNTSTLTVTVEEHP